jgi:hypothetical protein
VACTWAQPPESAAARVDVVVLANDGGLLAECKRGNDRGLVPGVFCPP